MYNGIKFSKVIFTRLCFRARAAGYSLVRSAACNAQFTFAHARAYAPRRPIYALYIYAIIPIPNKRKLWKIKIANALGLLRNNFLARAKQGPKREGEQCELFVDVK